ncbi:MAG: PAS domain S-box-containing protein [Sulfurimonas sp.]|jgi:PAS domain S-box-containing protein
MIKLTYQKITFSPLAIAFIYALFATMWIIFSDSAVDVLNLSSDTYSYIQTFKGLTFVSITSIIVFLMANRSFKKQEHLIGLLSIIRGVNQLIIREKEKEKLLQESCNVLVSNSTYSSALIITLDENNKIQHCVGTETTENFTTFKEKIKADWSTYCTEEILNKKKPLTCIEDIIKSTHYSKPTFVIELKYNDTIYGFLTLCIDNIGIENKDELKLLTELSNDISFALYNIRNRNEIVNLTKLNTNIINSTDNLIFVKDKNLTYISCNSAFEKFMNKSEDEIIGKTDYELFENEASICQKHDNSILINKVSSFNIEHMRDYNGISSDFLITKSPLKDSTGEVSGIVCNAVDITQQEKDKKSIRENNRRLSIFMQNLPGMAYTCKNDEAFTMSFISDGCLDLTGYKTSSLINNNSIRFIDIVHPDDRELVSNKIEKAIKDKESFSLDYRIITSSGEVKWVWEKGLGFYGEDGETISLEGVILDNNISKTVQQELKVSNDKFEKAFNNTPNLIALINTETGTIFDINETFEKILGYSKKEIIGDAVVNIHLWSDLQDRQKFLNTLKKKGSIDGEVYNFRNKNGGKVIVKMFSSIVNINNTRYILSIAEDITQKVLLENRNQNLLKVLDKNINEVFVFNYDDFHFKYVNKAGLSALGYSIEEMREKTPVDMTTMVNSLDEMEILLEPLKSSREKELYFKTEHVNVHGEKYSVKTILQIIEFRGKKQFIATSLDIRERVLIEDALRESEEKFKLLIEQSPLVTEIYDMDGLQVTVNRAYELLWDFPAKKTLNKFNILTSKEVEKTGLLSYVKRAYNGEYVDVPVYEFDPRGKTESDGEGRVRLLSTKIFPLKDKQGTIKNIVVTHEDVTKQEQTRNLLQEKKEELETMIQEIPTPVMLYNEDGEVLLVNKVWEELSGYKHEEINTIAKWTKNAFAEKMLDVQEYINTVYSIDTKIDDGEFDIITKSKKIITWHFSSAPLGIIDGKRTIISTGMDITELKQKDKLIMIQSRHAAMGEMIGMIAHQWRQPLSVIAMQANNMLLDIALNEFNQEEAEKYSYNVLKQTSHLSKTIDDFRNFFKPDKVISKVRMRTIMQGTFDIVKDSLKNHNINFTTSYESETEVDAYPRELMQVFVNIINNAKDSLKFKDNKNPTINIQVYEDEKYVNTKISDNGTGIDKEILEKIFDPYFSTKGEKNGTGLGLYMSKMIIENHLKGIIEAYNTQDGACFNVRLLK